jgi:hypothetical protein
VCKKFPSQPEQFWRFRVFPKAGYPPAPNDRLMGRGCGDASRALLLLYPPLDASFVSTVGCIVRMPVSLEKRAVGAGNASCMIAEAVISRRKYTDRIANKKSAANDAALCHEPLK